MGDRFATTQWSLVHAARDGSETEARRALESLCEAYWFPLYAFVRRRGYPADEAADLTQAFFADLLSRPFLGGIDRSKGRPRHQSGHETGHEQSPRFGPDLLQQR